MKYRILAAAVALTSIVAAAGMPKVLTPWPNTEFLDSGWLYTGTGGDTPPGSGTQWLKVTLPHTWNARDTLESKEYRRGVSWYRRRIDLTEAGAKQRHFLRFGAAGQEAAVFINGKPAGSHLGGYSAFTVEVTGLVHPGENQVDVRVTNGPNDLIVPLNDALFNLYGGLSRRVQWLSAPPVCLSRTRDGGPGLRVWSGRVSELSGEVRVRAAVDFGGAAPDPYQLKAELADPSGKVVATGASDTPDIALTDVANPELWSPEKPALYTLTVSLLRDGAEVDRATVRHGFRWFGFTAERGFFLNGKPCKLRGLNRHQDMRGAGSACTPEQIYSDIRLIKETGSNWLRLAHYQQDDYLLQLCDEIGLLVWEEVPYVRTTTFEPEFEANLQQSMREMIVQHFNHPSVVIWGMGNEIYFKKGPDGRAREFSLLQRLHDFTRAEDPTRPTGIVSGDANAYSDLKVMTIPDVIGYNLYLGWYGGTMDQLTARLEDLHRRDPSKPVVVTEFGAGCDPAVHTADPKPWDMSQEYQVLFLKSYLDQMDAIPWLNGYNWWNFADFAWAKSTNPPLYNNKGLVTFDRKKKDAYHYLKWRWTGAPAWPTPDTLLPADFDSVKKAGPPPKSAQEADPFQNPDR